MMKKHTPGSQTHLVPHLLEEMGAPPSKGRRKKKDILHAQHVAQNLAPPGHSGGGSGHWDAMPDEQ